MKILFINTFYYPDIGGGAEVSLKKLADNLVKKGNEVHVLCLGESDTNEIIDGVIIHRRKFRNIYNLLNKNNKNIVQKLIYKILDFYNIFNKKIIFDIVTNIDPDIIHINNIYGISSIIWSVLKNYNIPVIHTLRDYYMICPKVNLLNRNNYICNKPKIVCKIYSQINKKLMRRNDFITAPSNFTLDLFKTYGFENKGIHINNAIDFDINSCNNILNHRKNKIDSTIKYVYMGGIEKHKGIEWMLKSFSEVEDKNITLDVIGKGKEVDLVKKYCKIDNRIRYVGYLNEDKLNEFLFKCDVVIVPSIWNEPFGRVVIDGYKNIMPVIGSNIGGITEIIKNKKNGILVKPNSKEELKNAILYYSDRENIKKQLDMCYDSLKNFSIDIQTREFLELYKKQIELKSKI